MPAEIEGLSRSGAGIVICPGTEGNLGDGFCNLPAWLQADHDALTAKVLQVVNSAFFGLGRPIADVREAVAYLGLETVKALVL